MNRPPITFFRALTIIAAIVIVFTTAFAIRPALQKVTIAVVMTPASWPIYIAKDAGYYEKYGLDVKLAFGIHPAPMAMVLSGEAQMANYTLDQALQAASKDGSLEVIGSLSRKTLFALMARDNVTSLRELKGKRVGISQIGDGPYTYSIKMLARSGLTAQDVQWIPLGTNQRAAALVAGRIDATLLSAPGYFTLERAGFHSLANIADDDDVHTASVLLFTKTTLTNRPDLPEKLIKSHAEAIKRFYEDKDFAVKAFLARDTQPIHDVERIYDLFKGISTFERVPYVLSAAVKYTIDSQSDSRIAAQMKDFDFRTIIDNSLVERIVRQGFFQNVFGVAIKVEEETKLKQAFR